ncbi:MAG: CTP synthase C-terminal region-related (seleno)protein [Steroidobacter sp.]
MNIRVALIGDHSPAVVAHRGIPLALAAAAAELGMSIAPDWLHTSTLAADIAEQLGPYAAIWCVPGSPYANTDGALAAIRFARVSPRPFLGTCGGFQHALLEYANAEWGVAAPKHAELDSTAVNPVIAKLDCSLVNVSRTMRFAPGSKLALAYGRESASEEYQCSYGLNPRYAAQLDRGDLRATAWDADNEVRGVELADHPFYVATLFQPERAALRQVTPPLVKAFVRAAMG